ncbi:MAG: dihydroneopterin aldolase [Nitratiruptor sp.]|nr:dihydroneopterin aldolase [Nitratiruptor sp.]NPA82856.1 dihydroneopterin aldolase [Campylobacterota bacterium]
MIVEIEGLRFPAIIGLLPHERQEPQEIVIDAQLEYTYQEGHYLDYAQVAQRIKEHLVEGRFLLLEEALLSLMDLLAREFPIIERASVTISKPHILPDCTPKLRLQRSFR